DPVVQREPRARPPLGDLRGNPIERLQCQRLVRLVLQISDAPADVMVAHQAEKRDDRSVGPAVGPAGGGERCRHGLDLERRRSDREERRCRHVFIIPAQKWSRGPRPPPSPGACAIAPATYCWARAAASARSRPRASDAATADAYVHPVPWVCLESIRITRCSWNARPSNSRSTTGFG